jgi:hypothetical protein
MKLPRSHAAPLEIVRSPLPCGEPFSDNGRCVKSLPGGLALPNELGPVTGTRGPAPCLRSRFLSNPRDHILHIAIGILQYVISGSLTRSRGGSHEDKEK